MTTTETAQTTTTDATEATTLPEGSADEKRFLLAASDTLDALFVEWVRAGRDADELASELRICVTQASLHARRKAEGAT